MGLMKITTYVGRRADDQRIVDVVFEEEGDEFGAKLMKYQGVKLEGARPFTIEVNEDGPLDPVTGLPYRHIARICAKALAAVIVAGLTLEQKKALEASVKNLTLLDLPTKPPEVPLGSNIP